MSDTQRQYNFIFASLVNEPDELVGLIAYGIYKKEKIGYIEEFTKRHERGPTDTELNEFHCMSVARIDQYRGLAEARLAELLDELIADQTEIIQRDFESRYKQDLAKAKTSWSASIIQSFLGSVLFTFFIGFVVVIIIGWRDGISTLVKEAVKLLSGQ